MSNENTPNLFAEFPAATPADWRKLAEESLAGAPFEKKLVTRTAEGIDLRPIYTADDVAALSETWPGLPPYVRDTEPLGRRAAGWHICQDPGLSDPAACNATLLRDLQRGQNAVSLTLPPLGQGPQLADAKTVAQTLAGVDLQAVPIFVQAGLAAAPATARLTAWLKEQGRAEADLHGAVLADPLAVLLTTGALPVSFEQAGDDMAEHTRQVRAAQQELRTIGVDASRWADAGAHAVQELAAGLATGIEYLRALHRRGIGSDGAAPRFLFTFALGSNLFMEIAKLRAARLVWARAVAAAGGGAVAQKLVCHGRTTRWNKTLLDPHVNLLRTTTEAFAGIVGGCAGLQIGAFDECIRPADDFSRRLARNIQIILDEECQLRRVVDPAGGSWYVESLTRELATRAWALFQDIEKRGGMLQAVASGWLQGEVAKTATQRMSAVESRRDPIIGTNLHPNLRDDLPPATATPVKPAQGVVTATPLVSRRRAEPFEALRRRTEAHFQRTGQRPQVYLATFGPRKQHAARADFATGFFAAGGFAVIRGKSAVTPEEAAQAALATGAPLVVLCSTDDTYPELVPPTAKILKASAKAPLVVLAGLPADPAVQTAFKTAGVDEFIHLRANCAQLLAGCLTQLGI